MNTEQMVLFERIESFQIDDPDLVSSSGGGCGGGCGGCGGCGGD
jgi:hypothetical protein